MGSQRFNLVVSNLVLSNFYAEALFVLFCALLRLYANLHLRSLHSFSLFRAHLRASAFDCV